MHMIDLSNFYIGQRCSSAIYRLIFFAGSSPSKFWLVLSSFFYVDKNINMNMLKLQQLKSEELLQAAYNKISKENELLEKELAFEESSLEIEQSRKA